MPLVQEDEDKHGFYKNYLLQTFHQMHTEMGRSCPVK